MSEYTWACCPGKDPVECARDCRPAEKAAMAAALKAACASAGIEHDMDTADALAAYLQWRINEHVEHMEAAKQGAFPRIYMAGMTAADLAEYQAEAREWAELDVEVRE